MLAQSFLNILHKDFIVGCEKLRIKIWKFALLSCHSKNNFTQNWKVKHQRLSVADCRQVAPSVFYQRKTAKRNL